MSVEDILMPSENVLYRSSKRLKLVGSPHHVVVTNHRLILWKKEGLMGRVNHTAHRLKDMSGIELKRGGLLGPGRLHVYTPATTMKLEGPKAELIAVHQFLNQGMMLE